jgi:membrane associated rhomboid family serine protease/TolA-binding protein
MLLPYASDRPPRNPPLTVVCLVLVNFLIFGLTAVMLSSRSESRLIVWWANLSLVPTSIRWYAPLTYAFLHQDVLHLSSNMLFLWVFGSSVEDALKWKRFLLFYLGAAILTGLLQAAMTFLLPGADRATPIIGASGAVSAVIGVFAVRFYRSRIKFVGLPWQIPALGMLMVVLLGEMAATLWQILHRDAYPGQAAAHWAHIGGFILGMGWAQATRLFVAGKNEYMTVDAHEAMQKGSPFSAVRRWEAVLLVQPDNMDAEAELGKAWALAGDKEQGLEHYLKAIATLLKHGRKVDAVRRYKEMTGFYPQQSLSPEEQFVIAAALEEGGDFEAASSAFGLISRFYPDATEAERADLRLGVLYLKKLNSPQRAVAILETFLEKYPQTEWRAYAEDMLRTARGQS